MKKNEEYVGNKGMDMLMLGGSILATVAFLLWKPEWVWVTFPFFFTSLASLRGRL